MGQSMSELGDFVQIEEPLHPAVIIIDGDSSDITFAFQGEPLIILRQGKFIWKNEEIDDVHQIYERFNDWLKLV